ncbi:thiamine biosynthesis protein ThiJ [Acidihalobacter yilgarnensis]|uniref:Thiamine biosynthesis protein ThiJ n=1 Tax=Acidihalobacter yilgarnensis TaxID=2819280 RepID=A0A1D8ITU2_9GAMM|nr:DJ-1/PfpI family protein [Acidihalobacter yilgarnensis]AOU99805.1 thiamine biosynthesis protein ThiJ [Acidihalobacter yilgarnensis]
MHAAILLFDEVEVLDFAGPFEVLSTASRLALRDGQPAPFEVFTVAETAAPVRARGGLQVNPDHALAQCPSPTLLLVPGGDVSGALQRPALIDWIARTGAQAKLTASVCTGAFLLAEAGLLRGRRVTTHWEDLGDLRDAYPDLDVVPGVRWVDAGDRVTSAGITAGIDMSLHLVARLAGEPLALRTARQMDFEWRREGE